MSEGLKTDQSAVPAVPPPVPAAQTANLAQLRAVCPGADNDFLVGQLDRKATTDQARTAWMDEQNRRLQARQQEVDAKQKQLDEAAATAAVKRPGVQPLGDGAGQASAGSGGDPEAEWKAAIDEQVKAGKTPAQAVRAVAHAQPELRQAMLAAVNEEAGHPLPPQ